MTVLDCPNCGGDIEWTIDDLGEQVQCPTCRRWWITDYEEDHDGITGVWITGEAKE